MFSRITATVALVLGLVALAIPAASAQTTGDCAEFDLSATPRDSFHTVGDWDVVTVVLDNGDVLEFFDVPAGTPIAAPAGTQIVRITKGDNGEGPIVGEVTPTPVPEPTPEATATPVPEPTPEPTPEETTTPEPTPTTPPQPTATVAPSPTPDAEVLGRQDERLAETGVDSGTLALIGVGLLAVGATMLGAVRSTRRSGV